MKTELWDTLGKTDPHHTKGFKRSGGFSGTAVKPMWVYRRLTEQFGAVGMGWGHKKPDFQVVAGADGEVAVYCIVECWHTDPSNGFFGVGGDKVVGKNKHGLFTDDEAFKKAFTDAVMNAFKSVGVAADVHMGLFDDDKYVAQMEREFEPKIELITDSQRDEIAMMADAAGVSLQRICEAAKIQSLKDMPAAKFAGVKSKLNATLEKNKEAA